MFYEVGKYFTWTKHQLTATTLLISKPRFETWPKDIQDLVLEEARILLDRTTELTINGNKESLEKMRAASTEILTDIDPAPFREKTKPIWSVAEEKAGKEYFARFLDAVEKSR